ncbi:hypothetical protein N7495_006756 [Penicillium taxi]|uniref:uncharacterized protein n=1 Tax=Penicillium taxi TaxID=168475 RepID=UPI0025459A51|nr:uncharacterized protein N7495_006756 [Penicillium taxi]KAJ5895065.1 hypothetical protein N7495_006756 [Penicillium taxi]
MKGLVGGIPLALLVAALQAQAMEQGTGHVDAALPYKAKAGGTAIGGPSGHDLDSTFGPLSKTVNTNTNGYEKTTDDHSIKISDKTSPATYGVALGPGAGPFPKLPPGGAAGAGPFHKRDWPRGGTAIGGPSGDDEGQSFNLPITGVFNTEVTEINKDDHSIKVKDKNINAPVVISHPGPEFVHGPETGYRTASGDDAKPEHFHVPATEYGKRWDEFGGTAIGGPSGGDGDNFDEGHGDASPPPYVGGGTALGGPSGDDEGISFGAPVNVGINTKVKEYSKDDHSINLKHEDIWYKRDWDPRDGTPFGGPNGLDEFGDAAPYESEGGAPSRDESHPGNHPDVVGGTAIGGPSGNDGGQSFNMPISIETNTDIKEKYQDDHSIDIKHEEVYAPPHFGGGPGPYVPEGGILPFDRRAVRNPAPTADRVAEGPGGGGGGTAEGGPSGDDDGIDFNDPENLGISTDVDEKHQDNHAIKIDDTDIHAPQPVYAEVPEMPWMSYPSQPKQPQPEAPKPHAHITPKPPVAEPAPPAPAPEEPETPKEAWSAPPAPPAPAVAPPSEAPQESKEEWTAPPAPAAAPPSEAPQEPKEAWSAPPAPVVEEAHVTPEPQTPPCTTRTEEILLTVTRTAHKQVHPTETVYAELVPSHAVETAPSVAVPVANEPAAKVVESTAAVPPPAAAPTPFDESPGSSSSWSPASAPTDAWSSPPAPTDSWSSAPTPTETPFQAPKEEWSATPTGSWSSAPTSTDAWSSPPAPTDSWSSAPAPTETPFQAPKEEWSATPTGSWSSTPTSANAWSSAPTPTETAFQAPKEEWSATPTGSWSSTPTPTDSWSSNPTSADAWSSAPTPADSWSSTSTPTEAWSSAPTPTETAFQAPKEEWSATPTGSWSSTPTPADSWSSTPAPTDAWTSPAASSPIPTPETPSSESEAPLSPSAAWSMVPVNVPTSSMVSMVMATPSASMAAMVPNGVSPDPSSFAGPSPSSIAVFKGAATHVTGGIVSVAAAVVGVLAFIL